MSNELVVTFDKIRVKSNVIVISGAVFCTVGCGVFEKKLGLIEGNLDGEYETTVGTAVVGSGEGLGVGTTVGAVGLNEVINEGGVVFVGKNEGASVGSKLGPDG